MRCSPFYVGSLTAGIVIATIGGCSSGGDAGTTSSNAAAPAASDSAAASGSTGAPSTGPAAASASATAEVFNFTPQDKAVLVMAAKKYVEALFSGDIAAARAMSMSFEEANSLATLTSNREAYDKRVDAFYASVEWIAKDREEKGPLKVDSVEVVDVSAMTKAQAPTLKVDHQKAWIRPVVLRDGKPAALPGRLGKVQADTLYFIHTPNGWRHAP